MNQNPYLIAVAILVIVIILIIVMAYFCYPSSDNCDNKCDDVKSSQRCQSRSSREKTCTTSPSSFGLTWDAWKDAKKSERK